MKRSSKKKTVDKIIVKKTREDRTFLWSKFAQKKPHYNRMDPDPDPESDSEIAHRRKEVTATTPTTSSMRNSRNSLGTREHEVQPSVHRDKYGNIKKTLTRDDWRKFWVDRLRKLVDAPNVTDKYIADEVDRERRVFFQRRSESRVKHIDPDLPSCYYWDAGKVSDWVQTINLPEHIPLKDMFLNWDISGRHLITVDANFLIKMGIYDLSYVKIVTKAVRKILGLPAPNGMRAISRIPPMEKFLRLKIRTGTEIDKMTFKNFCEKEGFDYESAKLQVIEGYKPIPACCYVVIKPSANANVKLVPATFDRQTMLDYVPSSSSSSESAASDDYLRLVPTVEELVHNVEIRNSIIPQILNELVERVYEKISILEDEKHGKQHVVDEIFNEYMTKVYSDFSIFEPKDQLKFITIIAEELVNDIVRAREILEDIDGFQQRRKIEISEEEMENVQEAVELYVQNIMPFVVSSAMKLMEKGSETLLSGLDANSADATNVIYKTPGTPNTSPIHSADNSHPVSNVNQNAEQKDSVQQY